MKEQQESTRDLKSWLKRSLKLKNTSFDKVVQDFKELLSYHGFKIKNKTESEELVTYEAIYGSRIIAILMGFIPYIGKHLPLGKRFGLKASITNGDTISLRFDIVPYMEIFNTSEVFILTQSVDEKASDEYIAARKMFSITKAFYDSYEVDPVEKLEKFDNKTYFRDSMLTFLIYPLDGYKSTKRIHFPTTSGPKWCWPAFIIPEFWFIWHEIWGVSLLTGGIEIFTALKLAQYGVEAKTIGWTLLAYHFFLGLTGNYIFYLRYGRWPKDKK